MKELPFTLEDVNLSHNQIEEIPDLSKHRFLKKLNLNNN
jgi:Leucine-rich repeat (LRR) protein